MSRYNSYNYSNPEAEVTWDFRQFFVNFVGVDFVKYSKLFEEDNYIEMLKVLDGIHSKIWGRVKKKWDEVDETYETLREDIVNLSNKHKNVWINKKKDAEGVDELRQAFNRVLEYSFFLIDRNDLFGKRKYIAGL